MWCSLNLAVTSLHKIFHRLQKNVFYELNFIKEFNYYLIMNLDFVSREIEEYEKFICLSK
jgi:hypothetical protein